MNDIPRRTVDELVVRYVLEPKLRDVFVEGWFDHRVIRWFVRELSLSSVAVYEIDGVEIDASDLADAGLPDNTRSRVIFLAIRLSAVLGQDSHTATCIADRDYDFFCGSQLHCGLLLYSDLSSMEMYFYRGRGFRDALTVDVGLDDNVDELFSRVDEVLRKLFIFRCTNISLGWGMEWLEPWKCFEIKGDRLLLDDVEFVSRYLNKNGRTSQKVEFAASVTEIRAKADAAPHLAVRGHDAFQVLSWFLQKRGRKRELCEESVLQAIARSSSRIDELLQYPLFTTLQLRLTT